MTSVNELPKDIHFLCEWIHDFDKLLNDKIAIKLFGQFLKNEYSYENIRFWKSCQRYKKIVDKEKTIECANHIYNLYLGPGAHQAVNVDNRALNSVEMGLKDPKPDLFDVPEKQIYELMKFDCYKRFLKSFYTNNMTESAFHEKIFEKIYKCQTNDTENQMRYRKNAFKKLKTIEFNEINRRINKRKLLRNLSPKKKLINGSAGDKSHSCLRSTPVKCGRMQRSTQMESIQWIQSNMSSAKSKPNSSPFHLKDKTRSLIVFFSNGSQEEVFLNKSQTIKQLLDHSLKQRNLNFTAFEAFPIDSDKELDLNSDVFDLVGHRIRVEQRVCFTIELPNGLTTNVKTKPTIMSAKVLNPILSDFNRKYDPEFYDIKFADTWETLAPDMPIFCADNRKLVVIYKGVNENKSLQTERTIGAGMSLCSLQERQILSDFLSSRNKNKHFLNISDISFNDENKSEEFFNDLMKSSQNIPKETNALKLTPKLRSKERISPKYGNKKTINSPKLKFIDFKKSSPNLKSDQLYDKTCVERVDNLNTDKKCLNSIKTLSKYHKTSNEKLLRQQKSRFRHKLIVPQIFEMK